MMDIKKRIPNINNHIDETLPAIEPDENAHLGLCVPEIIFEYGNLKQKAKSLPRLAKYMLGCIREIKKSYRELYKQPSDPSDKILDDDLNDLYRLAEDLGIGEVGFAKVNTSLIFSDKKILYPNAIVILMEMKHDLIETAPSKIAEKEIFRTYYELNVAVNKIKDFLNERGYNAEAGPALGGEVNYPLLAQKAGMGGIGKHGVLITPNYGPSLRLAAVYTDIENLPFVETNDHMWINKFCNQCNRCVKKCPAKAIYKDSIIFSDGSKKCIDYVRCAVPFSNDYGCTVCIKECVFFRSDYDKIKSSFSK